MTRHPEPAPLKIAVRVYPDNTRNEKKKPKKTASSKRPTDFLVFDTETRTDETQSLLFGSYRYFQGQRCMEEGLFYGDDITEDQLARLQEYAANNKQDTRANPSPKLLLLSRGQFIRKLYKVGYKSRSLVIGFNLPFDFSRIACDATPARGAFGGGFSLGLDTYLDEKGMENRNAFLPRIGIRHINSKSALKGFTARKNPDAEDRHWVKLAELAGVMPVE